MLKKWYSKHKEWLSLFSSAFVGTLLGIGITFGISVHTATLHKEEITKKYLKMTLFDLQSRLLNALDYAEKMQSADSVFSKVEDLYLQKEKIDVESFQDFQAQLSKRHFLGSLSKSEPLSINNMGLLEFFDDMKLINSLGDLCTYINTIDHEIYKIENYRLKIFEDFCKKRDDFFNSSNYDSEEEAITKFFCQLFKDPDIGQFINEHWSICQLIMAITTFNQNELDNVLKSLEVEKTELKNIGERLQAIEMTTTKSYSFNSSN